MTTTDTVTTDVVNALAKRVEQLEYKVSQIQNTGIVAPRKPEDLFADNETIARIFRAFLDAEGITGEPIGAEELQQMIGFNEQDPNEFSRGIIEMREE